MHVLVFGHVTSRHRPLFLLLGVTTVLFYFLLYAPLFPALTRDWYEHENFSYGFLIPFIVLYLLWQERELLRPLPIRATPLGALSLLSALAIGLIGKVVADQFTMRLSMVLALGGLVHLLLGKRYLKALLFPLAYLLLMIPPPYLFVKQIAYHLRVFDAALAAGVVQALGIPIYRDSYFLHLPNITLEVADVCSGTASLFAMIALGTIYARFLPVRLHSKAVVMAGTIVFPVLANLFRIILVSASVYYYGPVMLGAFFHHFTGTFTFLLSLMMLLFLGEVLRRKDQSKVFGEALSDKGRNIDEGIQGKSRSSGYLWTVSFSLALALLTFAFYFSGATEKEYRVPLTSGLRGLPVRLGSFVLSQRDWTEPYRDSNAEIAISRTYEGGTAKEPLELYVGYRGHQTASARLQSPLIHFPDDHWNFVSVESDPLTIPGMEPISVNWMLTQKSDVKRLVLYWYQARGRTFSNELGYRLEQTKSLIFRGRTDAAVIRIATPLTESENVEQAKVRLKEFTVFLYPSLLQILPR
jgi:EpsI family protein